jgi:ankyrin repeat protein
LNRSVLEDILFDFTYRLIKDMFDRMLAKDCPLHYALLVGNKETVNTLLAEGCDFSAEDEGGRTFMHIIAMCESACWDEIKQNVNYKAFLNNRDSVLQWTPLQYAMKSKSWSTVERLLESNVDRSGLDMIRQMAEDPHYIAVALLDALRYGYVLLPEFLRSIDVNIHQEITTSLPTPLHAAIQSKELKVVKWLLQHGADCNTQYNNGETPLFLAVAMPSLDIVRALVEEGGARLDICDGKGRTVIDWAKRFASNPKYQNKGDVQEIVKYLEEKCKVSSSVRQNINT